jgi:nitroimidazol reductase NimA-like FMN-containing flavoprotein (pyridoxamine 5'-phosphate oxidase superfamily)
VGGSSDDRGRQSDPGAIERRIAERRRQLGLSEDDLAAAASMAPRYLQHLLEAGPDFDPGGFVRIAVALHLTYQELVEGRGDLPPGQTGPGAQPVLARLTVEECWDKLGIRGMGRLALPIEPGPAVFPVNYGVDARSIVYRTVPGGAAAPETGASVSFQVDRIDEHLAQGWSVLVTGTAERVEDPAAVRHLAQEHTAEPWAGGERSLWIRIRPDTVSGRRITTM